MKTNRILRIILALIAELVFLSCFLSGQETNNESSSIKKMGDDLDSYLTGTISEKNFIALGACLFRDDKIIWQNAYGYSDLEAKKELKTDDIFQLASLSKTITATAIMQLYEKGLFKLDDDVNGYLPFKVRNPNFPDKPITFRMLLTHTSGFDDLLPAGNKINLGAWGDSPIPFDEYVEGLFTPGGKYYSKDYFSKTEPGTKYEYSNIAFSLIGYLVEKLAKMDFSEYCKENIFKPMEMNNTGWHLKDVDTSRVVFGYGFPKKDSITGKEAYEKVNHFGTPGYPEGMLRSTMQDLTHFLSAYIHDGRYKDYQMLKPETVKLMLTPQGIKNIPSRSFPIVDIGLTWLIFDVEGNHLYSMNGFSGSIFTNAYFSQKDKLGIIYFYTGITMQNMPAMIEITKKLYNSFGVNRL